MASLAFVPLIRAEPIYKLRREDKVVTWRPANTMQPDAAMNVVTL